MKLYKEEMIRKRVEAFHEIIEEDSGKQWSVSELVNSINKKLNNTNLHITRRTVSKFIFLRQKKYYVWRRILRQHGSVTYFMFTPRHKRR